MDEQEIRDHKRQMKGAKDVLKMCHCGKQRAKHTIPEARECKKNEEMGLHQSVEPEKKKRSSLI